jgi:hypothetical protein
MTRTAKVTLHWIPSAADRPFQPPQNFTQPARFDHQDEKDWQGNAWSLTVHTEGDVDSEGRQSASVRFLMPNAPHDWLSVGKRFTIWSGRPLAEGVIKEILSD